MASTETPYRIQRAGPRRTAVFVLSWREVRAVRWIRLRAQNLAQFAQHDAAVGPHAAPHKERFRRLLDQHPEPIGRARAERFRVRMKTVGCGLYIMS